MNILFVFMLFNTFIKTWLIFNNVPGARLIDHILYVLMMFFVFVNLVINKKTINKANTYIKLRNIFLSFIVLTLFLSLFRALFVQFVTIKGIAYEVYKLIRNIPIFLYGYYFINKNTCKKFIIGYILISTIASTLGIFQYFLGLPFYEAIKLAPKFEDNPQFYLNYINEQRSFGLFQHPNNFGEFTAIAIFFIIYSKLDKDLLIENKFIYYTILIINFIGLLVSSSRMSTIMLIITLLFTSFKYKLSYLRRNIYSLIIMCFPIVMFAIEKIKYKLWQYEYYGNLLGAKELRVESWEQAVVILFKTAGWGSGLGSWGDASAKYSQSDQFYNIFGEQKILSDSYLSHILAENGFLVLLIILLFIILFRFFNKSYSSDIENRYYFIASISILIFVFITLFKGMSISVFENSFFVFMFIGYSLKQIK